jgi:hypothetical protein
MHHPPRLGLSIFLWETDIEDHRITVMLNPHS